MLTLSNVKAADDGTYNCAISSSAGSTNAAFVLTVVTPSPFEASLLSLNPLAYWPLDETSGTVAYDTVGGRNATYNGGVTIGQPGVPFTGFGFGSVSPTF